MIETGATLFFLFFLSLLNARGGVAFVGASSFPLSTTTTQLSSKRESLFFLFFFFFFFLFPPRVEGEEENVCFRKGNDKDAFR